MPRALTLFIHAARRCYAKSTPGAQDATGSVQDNERGSGSWHVQAWLKFFYNSVYRNSNGFAIKGDRPALPKGSAATHLLLYGHLSANVTSWLQDWILSCYYFLALESQLSVSASLTSCVTAICGLTWVLLLRNWQTAERKRRGEGRVANALNSVKVRCCDRAAKDHQLHESDWISPTGCLKWWSKSYFQDNTALCIYWQYPTFTSMISGLPCAIIWGIGPQRPVADTVLVTSRLNSTN